MGKGNFGKYEHPGIRDRTTRGVSNCDFKHGNKQSTNDSDWFFPREIRNPATMTSMTGAEMTAVERLLSVIKETTTKTTGGKWIARVRPGQSRSAPVSHAQGLEFGGE